MRTALLAAVGAGVLTAACASRPLPPAARYAAEDGAHPCLYFVNDRRVKDERVFCSTGSVRLKRR